ncbi:unnamed protein product [Adineta steineri]|uniref:Uncharacterized protein n=1 Tax=Adineta steineri TaxID=433720 RepID=A0A819SHJ9_9BILA|nr:unnamed protein product [Adineta steineri]CAF4039747.1 unnamed protein product [Adineta steineri]CAF4070628.1 unnamed protein product [Adineta steineri]
MSIDEKSMTQEVQDIGSEIQSVLINCYNHLQWQFSDGILEGFRCGVTNKYIYKFRPDSDNEQIIRLVFNEKLEPNSDTLERVADKFNRIEFIRLVFPTIGINNLPTDWIFTIEKTDIIHHPPLENVITPISLDENGRLQISLLVKNINIYGKNKLSNEQTSFDWIKNGNASLTIVSTLICYDCPLHHYNFLIAPDNIPNFMNCTATNTKQNFYSDDNGKTSKLQGNPNKGVDHAKFRLEASTIETHKPPQLSFATDLSSRTDPLMCFTYNNFTSTDECKPLFRSRQLSNAAEVCSTY